MRGGDKGSRIQNRIAAKDNAVWIDQQHPSSGAHLAEDLGRVNTDNTVGRYRGCRRLVKPDIFASTNGEVLPIDNAAFALLIDRDGAATLAGHTCRTANNHRAGGIGDQM